MLNKDDNMIQLKVCGMYEVENIRQVAALLPDYMGFIFYRMSRRFVGDAFRIPEGFPASIKRVGVFVNETTHEIMRLTNKHALSYVQLHGNESVDQCRELRAQGLVVIKVFAVSNDFDFEEVKPYRNNVDYFLFDTKGKDFGGNGVVFDWKILEKYDQGIPFFLSGGISPDNVVGVQSLAGMNLHALDVNSGVESGVGIKDVEKIREFQDLKISLKSGKI